MTCRRRLLRHRSSPAVTCRRRSDDVDRKEQTTKTSDSAIIAPLGEGRRKREGWKRAGKRGPDSSGVMRNRMWSMGMWWVGGGGGEGVIPTGVDIDWKAIRRRNGQPSIISVRRTTLVF